MGSSAWLRSFRPPAPGAVILACFPHAGGSAAYYRPLAIELPARVHVLGVQYPGHLDRYSEPFSTDARDLASRVAAELAGYQGQQIALFGHSMGALIAYEAARRLAGNGSDLLGLFTSGHRSPGRPRVPRVDPDDDAALLAEMARLGGSDPRFLSDPELRGAFLPAMRADFTLLNNYAFEDAGPLNCPIATLIGDSDPTTAIEEARGWQAQTSRSFQLHVFPGHHFYLASQYAEVAQVITRTIPAWLADRLPQTGD